MKLRIGHLSTFYHTSILMIAMDTLGDGAEWKLFGTGPAIVKAFEKGQIDLAYIGLPPAIIGIDRGVAITCVAGGHIEGTVISGRDNFKGAPELRRLDEILKQFSGRKIGVPGKGSIHDVILTECLSRFNLVNEIEVIHFNWADQIIDAVKKGEVQASFGTPALTVALKRYANGKVLYPPSELWPHNPSYGILVQRKFLENENEIVEKFLVLHEEATVFLRNKPLEAARAISDYVGVVDEDFILDTLKVSPKYCASLTDQYISSTIDFVKILKELGYISQEISSTEIFDDSLIKKIHPSKDHYEDGISAV